MGGSQGALLDTAAIERATGRTGQSIGDIFKVTFPRSDLHVTVDGVAIKPGLALTGWAAFKSAGVEAVVHGDLALTEAEVNSVVGKLRVEGVEVTAIHNHMINGTPELYFMHFWAHDTPARVAAGLKAALDTRGSKPPEMRH